MTLHDTHKPASTATKISSPVQRTSEQAAPEPETECTEQVAAPQFASRLHGQQQARMMQRMQRTVGNAQVQRMLKAAPAQPRPAVKATEAISPSTIAPAQRTAVPVAEVQRTPEPAVAASNTAAVQRTPAPIMRGWQDWNPINAGRRLVNAAGSGVQQLARAGFERALRAAGVNPGRVMGLINRAGGAIGSIISNPVRFANTLVNAVRQGFGRFRNNISTHLQSGFAGWLVGATGVSVPRDFSPPSVLSLVLQVLRINQAGIIGRVAQQAGAGNTEQIQQAQNEIRTAMRGGLGGLWPMLQESLGDLKTVVIDGLKQWVTETIVRAAIVRIASMFNPASGIIAAIRMIYDVVTFLIQRAGQIRALFEAVGNSASALAQGNVQQAAARIEQVLARSIPVAIGFLASLVGLNGVASRVREIIERVRSRVQSAINRMITRIVGRFRGSAAQRGGQNGQPAPAQSNAATGQNQLRQGVMAGVAAVNQRPGAQIGAAAINPLLAPLKQRYGLSMLEPVARDGYWAIHGEIRRMTERTDKQVGADQGNESAALDVQLSRSRHSLQGIARSNTPIKDNNTIIMEDEHVDLVRVKEAARQAYRNSGRRGTGTFNSEGITWQYDYVPRTQTEGYLHLTPTHSPPKAINLGRQEAKSVQNYQNMQRSGKSHEEAMEILRSLANRIPHTYQLSQNALLVIEALRSRS